MARPRTVSDDQILSATMTAIGRHGPARLTLAHVAQEVGLSPAALVQRFGSKAALLQAAAARGADQAAAVFDRAQAASSPVAAVVTAMAMFAGDIRSRDEMANHIGMLQLDLTQPDLREQAALQARTLRDRIADLLRDARVAGELDVDDPAAMADVVYTTYNGALITWAIDGSGSLAEWVAGRIRAVLAPYRAGGVDPSGWRHPPGH